MKSITFDYVEYGKVFGDFDATDFQILDRSNDSVLNEAGKLRCEKFVQWGLKYPNPASRTPFSSRINNISACFVKLDLYYLFIQIQRREEGEYARHIGNNPRLNRPFNQIRFTYIHGDKISQLYKYIVEGYPVFLNLLYDQNPNGLGQHKNCLKDYTVPGKINNASSLIFPETTKPSWSEETKQIANWVGAALNLKNLSFQLNLYNDKLTWIDRLKIIDELQILLWPITGAFTFSLDYISDRDDINLCYYETPLSSDVSLENLRSNASFFNNLVVIRERYKNYFASEAFLEKFRKYISYGSEIIDAGEIAYALSFGEFLSKQTDALGILKRSVEISQRVGDFTKLKKICGLEIDQEIGFVLECRLALEKENLELMLSDIVTILSETPEKIPPKHLSMLIAEIPNITKSKELRQRFGGGIPLDYFGIMEFSQETLELFLIKSETLLSSNTLNSVSSWFVFYLKIPENMRNNLTDILFEFYTKSKDSHTLSPSDRETILNDLLQIYKGQVWLFATWQPGQDKLLDQCFVDLLSDRSSILIKLFEAVARTPPHKVKIIKYFLSNNLKSNSDPESLSEILEFVLSPNIDLNSKQKLDILEYSRNIIGQSFFFYLNIQRWKKIGKNCVNDLDLVEWWFFEEVSLASVDDISLFYSTMSSTTREWSARLNPFFREPIDADKLHKACLRKGQFQKNIIYAIIAVKATSDPISVSNLIHYYVNLLPSSASEDILRYVLMHINPKGLILDSEIVRLWLRKSKMIVTGQVGNISKDTELISLLNFLNKLNIVSDDLAWDLYVEDFLVVSGSVYLIATDISAYVGILPKPKSLNSKYALFFDSISRAGQIPSRTLEMNLKGYAEYAKVISSPPTDNNLHELSNLLETPEIDPNLKKQIDIYRKKNSQSSKKKDAFSNDDYLGDTKPHRRYSKPDDSPDKESRSDKSHQTNSSRQRKIDIILSLVSILVLSFFMIYFDSLQTDRGRIGAILIFLLILFLFLYMILLWISDMSER